VSAHIHFCPAVDGHFRKRHRLQHDLFSVAAAFSAAPYDPTQPSIRGVNQPPSECRSLAESSDGARRERIIVPMIVSRKLAHKIQNRLQLILGAIEIGSREVAVQRIRELSELVNRHVESPEEEKQREARANEP
jgi:hypothetical protein